MEELNQTMGLSVLNPTPAILPGPTLLHDLVRKSTNQDGPAIDFLAEDQQRLALSYASLDLLSDRLAERISQSLQASPAQHVTEQLIIPLMIPQSPDLYVALLAILKSGAAFCPINLDAPADRVSFIFKDVQASLVLTTSRLAHRIPAATTRTTVICVDQEPSSLLVNPEHVAPDRIRARECTPHDLAYVMYTSGSTGTPKGVGISHLAATQSLLAHDRHIPAFSRFLQFAAPTFDVSVFEIFFPLFRGETLVCCNRTDLLSDLSGIINKLDVDACELTPSVAGSLVKKRHRVPKLKLMLTIGEMLTEPVVQEFGGDAHAPGILWGMYGPTEAAIHCTLQPAFGRNASPSCIGIPLDTVSAFVITAPANQAETLPFEIAPIGQVGELVVGGHQLATGYLNRPEQNAASFIDTEFGRVYKTGDKARILPDGTIECLGRVSEGQIKLNGQRMEIGEVEHAILRTHGCHSAYVCVISNVLVAFAAVDEVSGMRDEIIANCKRWLPAFMIPSEIVVMESFPRLPSGKIDRMRLKQDFSRSQVDQSLPREEQQFKDDLERLLCISTSDMLDTSVQLSTRLSSVGVDSLLAIQLAAQLRDSGISVSPLDILSSANLADLHQTIKKRESEPRESQATTNGHREVDDIDLSALLASDDTYSAKSLDMEMITDCTSLQVSMLVETIKDPKLYVNTVDIAVPRNTSYETIKSWFIDIAQKNEILRSGFIHLHDRMVRVVWKQLTQSQICRTGNICATESPDIDHFLEHPLQIIVDEESASVKIILHHAIYDGWTIDVLIDDLTSLVDGQTLPDRPSFRSVAHQLASKLPQNDSDKEFWAEHLRNSVGASLPNFKTMAVPNPEVDSHRHMLQIDPRVVQSIALQSEVTPQAIFQSSLLWFWGAITGADDVNIGSVFSGRTLPVDGIERVMGPCLSTLPIRARLAEGSNILDLVRSTHTTNRQIMHQNPISLADIKKLAKLPQGSTLFDVLFVYQESLSSRRRKRNSIYEINHKDHVESPLLLEIEPLAESYRCKWTFHSDAFSMDQVQSFAQLFSHLCTYFTHQIHASLDSILSSFPSSNLSICASDIKELEICSSLPEVVEMTAESKPQAVALSFASMISEEAAQTEELTYEQLNQRANQVARYLVSLGAMPGGIIAIVMEKSPLLYCAILGILKTGCAYLPLLPSTPQTRIQMILDSSRPQMCLVEDTLPFDRYSVPCTLVGLRDHSFKQFPLANLDIPQKGSQLAYVIFTSGTTGTPKGVSVTNKNMLSNIKALENIYPVETGASMLQACSQAFDVSVFEIFFAWANGMRLCAATNDTLFADLEMSIRAFNATHLSMTVTVASLINPSRVPCVKFLVTSGEPMTDEVLEKWNSVLYQGYGPSETTNICTVRKVYPGDSSQYLGSALENTSSFVFHPSSNHVLPLGCIGELCFGGDQVAAGYLNMPETTAAKFFEHPQYGKLYRSGDKGRMLSDGSLIILGRLDSQVKLRGQRIELREIQAVALDSGVARACSCVLLRQDAQNSQQLVLFYVPSSEDATEFNVLHLKAPRKEEIRKLFQVLQDVLPAYMIPSFIVPISCLPLTSSGKTNTDRLRESAATLSPNILNQYSTVLENAEENSEWTTAEEHILDALATTLGVEKRTVSRWTSFATLGLDSISAMPLSRRLQLAFGCRVPISQILQNPSIGRLAKAITSSKARPVQNGIQSTRPLDLLPDEIINFIMRRLEDETQTIEKILPCTPLQASMLASTISSTDPFRYRNQMIFRIHGDGQDLMSYWQRMRFRHDILRTCFVSTDDALHPVIQLVLKPTKFLCKQLLGPDLEGCAAEHLESLQSPLDSLEPPISLALITTSERQRYLSFVCHHALYDGVAIRTLLSEIERLARGEALPATPPFSDFLREALTLPKDTDDFWGQFLKDFTPRHLPHGLTINGVNGTNGVHGLQKPGYSMPLSSVQTKLRDTGVSLLSLCQAAWSETLSLVLKSPDVCFGNVFSGRSVSVDNVDELVAPCFNTIPLRLKLLESSSHRDLMKTCQKLNATMLQYQFTPLRRIRSKIRVDEARLFDSLLLLQPPTTALDQSLWILERDVGTMDVPIVCEITPDMELDELRITVHRDSGIISSSLGSLLNEVFVQALNDCVNHPSSTLSLAQKLPAHLQSQIEEIPSVGSSDSTLVNGHDNISADDQWSEHELQIRRIIGKLAKIPREKISKNTSIYRLGLDSISAIQAATLLRREGLQVSPVDILEHPTCTGIASHIKAMSATTSPLESRYDLSAFQRSVQEQVDDARLTSKIKTVLPCTPLQQGMLSQFILSEGANYYNFVTWDIPLTVNCDALAHAWTVLKNRHQILRAGFVSISHSDVSFAMVVYDAKSVCAPVSCVKETNFANFDVQEWRHDCIESSLRDMSRPPWQAVLQVHDDIISMHLGMHHALYDASSLQQMIEELFLVLKNERLDPVRSIEQAVKTIVGANIDDQASKAFWKEIAINMVVNPFPTMTPLRVEVPERWRMTQTLSITLGMARATAAAAGITIQAALQSAWTRVLAAYQGETAVTFGVVLSGRTLENLANSIFPCIVTLPVVAQNAKSNDELLKSMMVYNAGLRRHEYTSLSQIQKWTGHADSAIFDTILVYQQAPNNSSVSREWRVAHETATVDYLVSLEVEETQTDGLQISLDFRSDVLPTEQSALLLAQFEANFIHLLQEPKGDADGMTLKYPDLYSVLPPDHTELPSEAILLHDFVEITADRIPDHLALEYVHELNGGIKSRKWTYRQLDDYGSRVANFLIDNGVTPGGIVAVCFDKCPEAYFSILGILKTGCAFVALDPGAPATRHQFILEDSKAFALMVQKDYAPEVLSSSPCPVLEVDLLKLESFSPLSPRVQISPEDACYCLYTSGTTGTPKGCLITHDNAVQAMLAFQQLFSGHWDHDSRWLQFASFHFDVSVLEQYWSWSVGIPVVSAPRDLILSDLISTISKLEITHIDLTPSLARLVHPDDVPSLCKGVFITGGEQLRQDILDVWGSKAVIYNAYGPTEATIGVTMYCRVPQNGRSSNIGKQFPNVGSFVLQPGSDVPVARGGVGELCVSGKLVGKGYLNRPELTAERFPTLERFAERVYRTGDLVRVLHDGCFDFLGRADDQVKLRGQRLEIGEINHTIKAGVPQVKDVATLVTKHRDQDRDVMVSFIVTQDDKNHDKELSIISDPSCLRLCADAQNACRAKLPGYMVPTFVLCVPYIPLSANNKAQTSILKQIFNGISAEELREISSGSKSTSTRLEALNSQFAHVVAKVTRAKFEEIRAQDTIFDLGVDSISVIELARQLQAAGFSGAAPSTILKNPQLGHLVTVLQDNSPSLEDSQVIRVKQNISACYHKHLGTACSKLQTTKANIEYIAPCTALQEGMLSRALASESQSTYFNTFQIRLGPDASIARMRVAWDKVMADNAILRTTFLQTVDGYIQVALKKPQTNFYEATVAAVDIDSYLNGKFDAWTSSNKSEINRALEVEFVHLEDQSVLSVRIFHGIYDARSFDLVLDHMKALYYNEEPLSGPAFIEVLPHGPLCDYSSSKTFWDGLFADFSLTPTPCFAPSNQDKDTVVSRTFDIEVLEARRLENGVTQQTIVQAAWLSVLARHLHTWPSQGVIVSGRSLMLENIENTIGPLFNTLPFRVRAESVNDWTSLIRETHSFNSSALSFAHVPLRQVQKWCSKGQSLFDNLFTFDRESKTKHDEHSQLWDSISSASSADYPLAFEGIVTDGNKLKTTLVAQPSIADEAALNSLLDQFQRAIKGIVENEDFPDIATISGTAINGSGTIGHQDTKLDLSTSEDFVWNKQARMIQREIVALSGLPADNVTEDTTLFELGLDSIDVVKLVTRLRSAGFSILTSQIMKTPSIRGIIYSDVTDFDTYNDASLSLESLRAEEMLLSNYVKDTGLGFDNIETFLPPTPLQDSMVAEMILSDFQRYFNHDVLEISSNVSMEALITAIRTVIGNSPILRTSFVELEDPKFNYTYCQVIAKNIDPFKTSVNLKSLDEIDGVLEDIRSTAIKSRGQSQLLQLTPVIVADRQYLIISIAHALYDGTSLDLFHQDVKAAWEGVFEARRDTTPVLAQILASTSDTAEQFWSQYLSDARSTLLVPTVKQMEDTVTSIHRAETVSAISIQDIKAFCMRQRITMQTLGQACWAAVLGTLSQSLNVTFGVVLSGRTSGEEQELMFPTMNTVAVRAVLHGTVTEYLQYMWGNMTRINEFQYFPLRKAQKLAASGGGPLFNTLFTMQARMETAGDESSVWQSVQSSSEVDYPVCVEMEVVNDDLVWRIACDQQYVSKDGAQNILDHLGDVLVYFIQNEQNQLIDLVSSNKTFSIGGLPPVHYAKEQPKNANESNGQTEDSGFQWIEENPEILDVLAEVSGLDRASITPNLSIYHLGLDSISAIRASSLLRKRGLAVSVRDMVKAAAIRDIVPRDIGSGPPQKAHIAPGSEVSSLLASFDINELVSRAGLDPGSVERVMPALPMQVHMLSIWENSQGKLYFYDFSYEVLGDISREQIMSAWHSLVEELSILRTYFAATDSTEIPFVQMIAKPGSQLPRAMDSADSISTQGIWLEANPFVCLHVAKETEESLFKLTLKIHHALYDGVSLPSIINRFAALCHAKESSLQGLSALWNAFVYSHYDKELRLQRQSFWREYLKGAAAPSRHAIALDLDSRTAVYRPGALDDLTKIKATALELGISVQALFFASYAKYQSRSNDTEALVLHDIIFGVYLANRTAFDDKLQDASYPTLSIVPLRIRFQQDESIAAIARRVQDDLARISSHENASVGLWEIAEWTGVKLTAFVNFLSLPSHFDGEGQANGLQIREVTPSVHPEYERNAAEALRLASLDDAWLVDNQVKNAYIKAVDVEAAIRGNGLDIGVFGSSSLVRENQASDLIDFVVGLLRDV
ncbi:hypothetical protein PFICI_10656 [Pestalotiopsis fici W106-1]|uniref:Carrier domain-containing protein n=1 Tax=Pestalotiopsis fici (strain W106-1 / CGMCC3.15140) TaxID=1229662 RepID=W3WXS3_PESFW|nr:uncharacterized protein PFICI_10656 [Pestalotiopsis fici W106-1]ETS78594.1 hypothetical protein PFICI_10656 [Pestalotiopsis fici W106-1]